jgi:hypothetical protein
MSKPQVKIVDAQTGEEIVRDANKQELAQMEIDVENAIKRKAEANAKAAQKQALLDKLGITADEAQLLLG